MSGISNQDAKMMFNQEPKDATQIMQDYIDEMSRLTRENEELRKQLVEAENAGFDKAARMDQAIFSELQQKLREAEAKVAEMRDFLAWINSPETDWENGKGSGAAYGFRQRALELSRKSDIGKGYITPETAKLMGKSLNTFLNNPEHHLDFCLHKKDEDKECTCGELRQRHEGEKAIAAYKKERGE